MIHQSAMLPGSVGHCYIHWGDAAAVGVPSMMLNRNGDGNCFYFGKL